MIHSPVQADGYGSARSVFIVAITHYTYQKTDINFTNARDVKTANKSFANVAELKYM
jgi:hypothetical protein